MSDPSRAERIAGLTLRASLSAFFGALLHCYLLQSTGFRVYHSLLVFLAVVLLLSILAGTVSAWIMIGLRLRGPESIGPGAVILESRMRRHPAPPAIPGRQGALALFLPFALLLSLVCIEEPSTSAAASGLRKILGGNAEFVFLGLLSALAGLFLWKQRKRIHARLGEVLSVLLLGTASMALVRPSTTEHGSLELVQVFGAAVLIFLPFLTGAFWGWSASTRLGIVNPGLRYLLLAAGWSAVFGLVALAYGLFSFVDPVMDPPPYAHWSMLGALLVVPAWIVERQARRTSATLPAPKLPVPK